MYNIVLLEPEIPQNTGNIVRTCSATGAKLHLIEPLGFEITDKQLKRAGLDYWAECDITIYKNIEDFYQRNPNGEYYYASTKAQRRYDEVNYPENAFIFFGKETKGLPEDLLHDNYDRVVRIPMANEIRSLNLSNSVAIVLYEALRQRNFEGLKEFGKLTKY